MLARSRTTIFLMLLCAIRIGALSQERVLPTDPTAFLQKLYRQVIWYQPLGILDYEYVGVPTRKIVDGSNARIKFMRYLSPRLRRQIAVSDTCIADWDRLHQKSEVPLKGPGFEGGIFSGGDEFGEPERFQIEKIEKMPDESIHASVRLSARITPPKWEVWHVELVLVQTEGHLGVEDISYYEAPGETFSLSNLLLNVCKT